MCTSSGRQPAGRIIEGLPRPDRRHGHRQPAASGLGEVRCRRGHHTHSEPGRQAGECGVALVVDLIAVVSELDAHQVGAESVHQISQRTSSRI